MADWARIKAEWCAGADSNRQIAKRHCISEAAVRKYAQANEWERGNPDKPNRPVQVKPRPQPKPREAKPLEPIEKSAQAPAVVTGSDASTMAAGALTLAERMLAELDAATSLLPEIEGWIEIDTQDDNSTARRNAMLKAISLPSRALTLKTIQQAITEMQKVGKPEGKKAERQAAAEKAAGKFSKTPAPPTHLRSVK